MKKSEVRSLKGLMLAGIFGTSVVFSGSAYAESQSSVERLVELGNSLQGGKLEFSVNKSGDKIVPSYLGELVVNFDSCQVASKVDSSNKAERVETPVLECDVEITIAREKVRAVATSQGSTLNFTFESKVKKEKDVDLALRATIVFDEENDKVSGELSAKGKIVRKTKRASIVVNVDETYALK